jgi:peptidoglycan hydrolase-like protein with peptidoglycan-binding domain
VAHDEAKLAAAIRAFQGARGLAPSGELDDATRDAIVADYGS